MENTETDPKIKPIKGRRSGDSNLQIRVAETAREKNAVYRFRYNVYVDEMGKSLSYADHKQKMLKDDLDDSAELFMAIFNTDVIATARLNHGDVTEFNQYWRDIYKLDQWDEFPARAVTVNSRLMVAEDWRGTAILGNLVQELFRHLRIRGVRFSFLTCAPSLLEFYEQLGYRRYTDGYVDDDVGYLVPVVFVLEDAAYMKLVHSPFRRVAREYKADSSGSEWLEDHFPEHTAHINKRLIDHENFWDILENNLHTDPINSIGLLANLDEDEAKDFLNTGTILPCKEGDLIIRPGDVGDEMFVVLEGVAEVWGGTEERPLSMALLGPGQVFGEIAFVSKVPRTAKVVANTDMKLLLLTQTFFNKAMKNMPSIVAKVLLNLSVVLCERLKGRTDSWVEAVMANEDSEINPKIK